MSDVSTALAGADRLKIVMPVAVGALMLGIWEAGVRLGGVPPYILPGPIAIVSPCGSPPPTLRLDGIAKAATHSGRI